MYTQSSMRLQEASSNVASVRLSTVPENDDVSAYVAQQMLQELNHLFRANVFVWMKSTIQPKMPASGRNGKS